MLKRYNVKPGDMIVTDIGSGIITKETRAYWFYLFKNRINRIKKTHFWQMVDCGTARIEYAENKKYRREQRKYRTLDVRGVDESDLLICLDDFLNFVSMPSSVVFSKNDFIKMNFVKNKLTELGYNHYEDTMYGAESTRVLRIVN